MQSTFQLCHTYPAEFVGTSTLYCNWFRARHPLYAFQCIDWLPCIWQCLLLAWISGSLSGQLPAHPSNEVPDITLNLHWCYIDVTLMLHWFYINFHFTLIKFLHFVISPEIQLPLRQQLLTLIKSPATGSTKIFVTKGTFGFICRCFCLSLQFIITLFIKY